MPDKVGDSTATLMFKAGMIDLDECCERMAFLEMKNMRHEKDREKVRYEFIEQSDGDGFLVELGEEDETV